MAFGFFKKKVTGADTIYFGGTIYTQDPDMPQATAVACKNGRVLAIGDDESILELEDENTMVIELEGEYMIPGLIDPAGHPVLEVFRHCSLYLRNDSPLESVLETLKNYIKDRPMEEVYFAYGFSLRILADRTMEEAAALLDELTQEIPIVVLADGGNGIWLNTLAIERAKQAAEKDMLPSINLSYILYALAPFHNELLEKESTALGVRYKNLGFTSVLSCGEPDYMQSIYQQCLVDMYQCGTHLQRYFGAYLVNSAVSPAPLMQKLLQRKTTCMELDDNFNFNMAKLVVDTTLEKPSIPRENLMDICMESGDKSVDLHIDVVGKDAMIHAVEAIRKMRNAGYKRNTAVIAHHENVEEINQHLEDPIDFEASQIVETVSTIGASGGNTAGGARDFLPDFSRFEHMTELIDFHTLKAAEIIGYENQLGIIRNGYYADFTVFASDPFQASPSEFKNLEVSMTVINGMPTKIGDMSLDDEFFDELEDFDEERAGLDGMRGLDNLGGIV